MAKNGEAKRPIYSTFLNHKGEMLRINRSKYGTNAVPRAVAHMQNDEYGAHVCEVFDSTTGTLWAVLRSGLKKGERTLEIVFKREA